MGSASACPIRVVGLGASAGGLEALEGFLRNLPADSGLAFVVVQHMDPKRPGMLGELLQRATPMPVLEARDGLKIRANHVYVIPPNKALSLLRGHLFLFDPIEPSLRRQAIDFFFRSLAEDMREAAVGILLSGMGSDGTEGLKAIKERGGLALVQDPATARFESMPRSALEANLADAVGSPATLALGLLRLALPGTPEQSPDLHASESHKSDFERICHLLRDRTGHDFSRYKKSTVYRRIERRMGLHGLDAIGAYARFLGENAQEADFLFRELLIGVTSFFRDPEAWLQLQEEVIPSLLSALPAGCNLRAWVAGCSTGEEAYSLAIAFLEVLDTLRLESPPTLKIFATDLDRDSIVKARQGVFNPSGLAGLSPQRLARWFFPDGNGFRIQKRVREMVVFAPHNLIQDPPFIRLDLVLCRNLLIYLSPELQKCILPLFHYALNPWGALFLGSAESIGAFSDLFAAVPGKSRIFRRQNSELPLSAAAFPFHPSPRARREPEMPKSTNNLQALADQALIQRFGPPAVVTTADGDILYPNLITQAPKSG
jgi:two-component system CheB/CheR fusion protein